LTMQDKMVQLNKLRSKVTAGGGEDKINKQHKAGKKTARERIDYLFDYGTFKEIGAFAGEPEQNPGEGVVTGYGLINGREVYVYAQDFTVSGGSLGRMHSQKTCKVLDLAMRTGTPIIGLNDSGGARIQEGVDALNGFGEILYRNTMASGVIPQICVIMGPCAGGAVYSPALMDFIFMVQGTGQMFITGPQVIQVVTGEDVSMEELGGAITHSEISGVAHFTGENEESCLDMVKKLLSYLPANNQEKPPVLPVKAPAVNQEELLCIIPDQSYLTYDVKKIINVIVDDSEFFEVYPQYAKNAVIGFGRIGGHSMGIVANQPDYLAGCLDLNASIKISRFVRFCDAFNIPLITFMDVPGFLPGTAQEFGGIIRHGAKILYAYAEASVPKVTIILRKAYGGAYIAMCSSSLRCDIVYAWPTAEIAVMGPESAVNITHRHDIENAEDPVEKKRSLIEDYQEKFSNPYVATSRGYVDDVIDPRETRQKIIDAIKILQSKQEFHLKKKHGNIPI